jgi:hypothetical protein
MQAKFNRSTDDLLSANAEPAPTHHATLRPLDCFMKSRRVDFRLIKISWHAIGQNDTASR